MIFIGFQVIDWAPSRMWAFECCPAVARVLTSGEWSGDHYNGPPPPIMEITGAGGREIGSGNSGEQLEHLYTDDTNFPERAEWGDNADIMCIIMRTGIANML